MEETKDFKKNEFKEVIDTLIEDENSVQLTDEEQKTLEEVVGLLEDFDKNLEALTEAKEEGLTRNQWGNYHLRKSLRRLKDVTEAEEERFIADIDQVIGDTLMDQVTDEMKKQLSTNQKTEEAEQ